MTVDLVLLAARILPIASPPLENAFLVIDEGRIQELGRGASPAADREIDLGEAAVIPGLVNAHTHLGCAFLRGEIDDSAFMDWLSGDVTPRVMKAAEEQRPLMEERALQAARELLEGGVTCVAESFFDACGRRALKATGQRGLFMREVFGSRADDLDDYVLRFEERVDEDRAELPDDLVDYGLAPHAPYTCPPRVLEAVVSRARREGMKVGLHLAESLEEERFFREGAGPMASLFGAGERMRRYRQGKSSTATLAEAGLIGPESLLVHGVQFDDADVAAVAAAGAALVHCPSSNARLAVGIAPIDELLEAGVTVALGTDSPASVGKLDMFEEMRSAIAFSRLRRGRPGRVDANQALRMATLDGARALGLDDRIGSLEPGKDADLAVIELGGARRAGVRDPISAIVHSSLASDVSRVFLRGREIWRRGS